MNERFDRLPKAMKDAIAGLHDLHKTPDNMNLQVVLGVANFAAAVRYKVDSNDGFGGGYGIRPIIEFFIGIAPTGAQKSTLFREVTPGLMAYQNKREEELVDDKVRYAMHEKKYANELKEYQKNLDEDPTAKIPKPPIPAETAKYLISKGTLNGIVKPLQSQPIVGLFSSEAGEFFNSHSFQGGRDISKAIEMTASLTSMWDGEPIEKNTGDESYKLKNRTVGMLFLLQEKTIQHVINNPMFNEQGFIHRLLITQSPRYMKPEWELSEEAMVRNNKAKEKLVEFNNRIERMMDRGVKTIPGKPFEIDYEIIVQSPAAVKAMVSWYNKNLNRDQTDMQNYVGFMQRIHEHCLRLAATIAAFDNCDIIQENHALCAIDLMDFYIQERINLDIGVNVKDLDRSQGAIKVLDWIKTRKWSGTPNDLRKKGPNFFRDMDVSQREQIILDLLKDEELILEEVIAANHKKTKILKLNTENTGTK